MAQRVTGRVVRLLENGYAEVGCGTGCSGCAAAGNCPSAQQQAPLVARNRVWARQGDRVEVRVPGKGYRLSYPARLALTIFFVVTLQQIGLPQYWAEATFGESWHLSVLLGVVFLAALVGAENLLYKLVVARRRPQITSILDTPSSEHNRTPYES